MADPAYPRGALFAKLLPDMWDRAERLGAWSVNFNKAEVSRSLVEDAPLTRLQGSGLHRQFKH